MIEKMNAAAEPDVFKHSPKVCNAKEAAQYLIGKKKVAILTGAGISAASGIPTFRGQDGFWKDAKNYAGEKDPMVVMTLEFFAKHPEANWEWHYDFLKLMRDKDVKVNKGHVAVNEFMEYCALSQDKDPNSQVESLLITQNIDDLHNRLVRQSKILMKTQDKYFVKTKNNEQAFTPHVYEVHGAVRYMHCVEQEKECGKLIIPGPTLAEAEEYQVKNNRTLVPTCADCGKNMKPHSMFFDEAYNEEYYRYTTVNDFISESDCLIVIGT